MDSVYENFVRQIAGAELNVGSEEKNNLKEDIEQAEEKKQLEKEITHSGHCNHCPRQNCDDPG